MELLIFRTDIKSVDKVRHIQSILDDYPGVISWSVDLEDIDNVLRIEATDELSETEVMVLGRQQGYDIRVL